MSIESIVLSHMLLNEEYSRKVLPFLKEEYFSNAEDKILFRLGYDYITKYNAFPTKEALFIELDKTKGLNEAENKATYQKIENLAVNSDTNLQWLLQQSEDFCSWQAIKNAILRSAKIVDGSDTKTDKGSIPKLMQDALAVSFDTHVGHNFTEDWEQRYEAYQRKEDKISFDLRMFNEITRGGLSKGSLNVYMAAPGVGKTLVMCHNAANNLERGYNVLYITLEMGEFGDPSISQRIDANLLNTPIAQITLLGKEAYASKIAKMQKKVKGKLIIKGYPTATAGSSTFRFLINELRLKKDFIPDVIYIDYLNICLSSRIKAGANVGTYAYVKSIAEELRGLGQEFKVPVVTATQLNRKGAENSDPTMEHASESYGLPMTADLLLSIYVDEKLEALNQYQIKQLKNRYADPGLHRRFNIGVDKTVMRLYDLNYSAKNEDINISKDEEATNRAMANTRKFDSDAFADFTN